MRAIALVAALLLAAWGTTARAAETACRVIGTMTFEVGKTVCILSARDTWLVCTAATAPTGGGAWKDTGVPCKEPQPKNPTDYRPVPTGPQPASPPPDVKRTIDLFRGVIFRCEPSVNLSWSTDACARIAAEFAAQAKAASIAIVIVDAADDDNARAKKLGAAGLKRDEAIDWVVTLRATDNGGAIFKEDVEGVTEVIPGIYDRRPLLMASDAYLHPASASQALAEAKTDFAGELEFLTRSR